MKEKRLPFAVRFYANLRQIAGTKTVEFSLVEGITVGQLVDAIVERYPAMRRELLDENNQLYGHVHVFVNGRDTPFLESGQETVLSADVTIDVFPAVGGG